MLLAPIQPTLRCCVLFLGASAISLQLVLSGDFAFSQQPTEAPELLPAAEALPPADEPLPTEAVPTEPVQLPAAHHGWGQWEAGAWRKMRITTESFDSAGASQGINVTTETDVLLRVEEAHYDLETQSEVEVGGKTLHGPGRIHRLQFLTDTADEIARASQQPPTQINLNGRAIPCSVWRITVNRSDRQLRFELYYNDAVWPFVLRREVAESPMRDIGEPLSTTRVSVVRSHVPVMLDGKIVPGAHFNSTTETPSGRTERFEVRADGVPGGVVSASTTEWDTEGRRIRWSTTELVEFGADSPARGPLRRLLRRSRQQ